MESNKFCPFVNKLPQHCWGEDCAWWNGNRNMCSLLNISTALNCIEKSISKIAKNGDKA